MWKYFSFICSHHKLVLYLLGTIPRTFFTFVWVHLPQLSVWLIQTICFNCLPFLITLAVACSLVSTSSLSLLSFLSSRCVFGSLQLPAYYLFSFSPRLLAGYNCRFSCYFLSLHLSCCVSCPFILSSKAITISLVCLFAQELVFTLVVFILSLLFACIAFSPALAIIPYCATFAFCLTFLFAINGICLIFQVPPKFPSLLSSCSFL